MLQPTPAGWAGSWPRFDFVERHATPVWTSAARAFEALRQADLAASPIVRLLIAFRTLPAILRRRPYGEQDAERAWMAPIRISDLEAEGFAVLAEAPPQEMLIGLSGGFWLLNVETQTVDAQSFCDSLKPGMARVAWNFAVEPASEGRCRVSTETHIECSDTHSLRRFRLYWLAIRPASGLIRLCMLRAIRKEAERTSA